MAGTSGQRIIVTNGGQETGVLTRHTTTEQKGGT
jgi:hypothetical protein